MGRQAPWDEVPASGVVPDGIYELEVDVIEEAYTREAARLMYKATYRVVEPAAFAGQPVWENYVIGSEQDPEAADPNTWKASVGARLFKAMLTKAQVPLADDLDEVIAAAQGAHFVAVIGQRTSEQGSIQNQIRATYAVGEKTTGLTDGAPAKPAARPAARTAPTTAPRQPAPAGRPAPAPAPAAAPAARRPAPAPAPAAKPVPAAKPAPAAMVMCGGCNEQIERAAFMAHTQECPGLQN